MDPLTFLFIGTMDPLSLIVSALVAGAAAALKPTAEKAIKDAYEGIKRLITDKYERVSVSMLENDPADETRKSIVKQDLEQAQAPSDEELLRQARALLALVKEHDPAAASNIGINLDDVDVGGSLETGTVEAEGSIDFSAQRAKVKEDLKLGDFKAGRSAPS